MNQIKETILKMREWCKVLDVYIKDGGGHEVQLALMQEMPQWLNNTMKDEVMRSNGDVLEVFMDLLYKLIQVEPSSENRVLQALYEYALETISTALEVSWQPQRMSQVDSMMLELTGSSMSIDEKDQSRATILYGKAVEGMLRVIHGLNIRLGQGTRCDHVGIEKRDERCLHELRIAIHQLSNACAYTLDFQECKKVAQHLYQLHSIYYAFANQTAFDASLQQLRLGEKKTPDLFLHSILCDRMVQNGDDVANILVDPSKLDEKIAQLIQMLGEHPFLIPELVLKAVCSREFLEATTHFPYMYTLAQDELFRIARHDEKLRYPITCLMEQWAFQRRFIPPPNSWKCPRTKQDINHFFDIHTPKLFVSPAPVLGKLVDDMMLLLENKMRFSLDSGGVQHQLRLSLIENYIWFDQIVSVYFSSTSKEFQHRRKFLSWIYILLSDSATPTIEKVSRVENWLSQVNAIIADLSMSRLNLADVLQNNSEVIAMNPALFAQILIHWLLRLPIFPDMIPSIAPCLQCVVLIDPVRILSIILFTCIRYARHFKTFSSSSFSSSSPPNVDILFSCILQTPLLRPNNLGSAEPHLLDITTSIAFIHQNRLL